MIPKEFIDSLVRKTNIDEVIAEYVELVPNGAQLRGPCPFHSDKNSFNVSIDKNIWKCFKYGRGGHVIAFVQEYKKISFPRAVALLAERLKMEVPYEQ